jgi:hypothetical protein
MMEALVLPKHRFLQAPHGVTSQKISFFIVIPVKTSNPTINLCSISDRFTHISLLSTAHTGCGTHSDHPTGTGDSFTGDKAAGV